jgi:hypothetical protein
MYFESVIRIYAALAMSIFGSVHGHSSNYTVNIAVLSSDL